MEPTAASLLADLRDQIDREGHARIDELLSSTQSRQTNVIPVNSGARERNQPMSEKTNAVLTEISEERARQDAKWGQQDHPNGTGEAHQRAAATTARRLCEQHFTEGRGTWVDILREEVQEAFAESDPARLREELVQVGAVAAAWVEAIDRAERRAA